MVTDPWRHTYPENLDGPISLMANKQDFKVPRILYCRTAQMNDTALVAPATGDLKQALGFSAIGLL